MTGLRRAFVVAGLSEHFAALLVLVWVTGFPVEAATPSVRPVWQELPSLPDPIGVAGPFAGVSGDRLMVAGGANFPEGPPWVGGAKVWHDRVYGLGRADAAWREIGRLPRPLAYGVSVTWDDTVICLGGGDADRHYPEVFALEWTGEALQIHAGPPLPVPLANAAAVLLGDVVYVAGGCEGPDSVTASARFWRLDLSSGFEAGSWTELPAWPGPERILPVMASQQGRVLLVSGARLLPDANGNVTREYLNDAYAFDRGEGVWSAIAGPSKPLVAAPSPAIPLGHADVLFLAGDDGEDFFRQAELQASHPGFPAELQRYNVVTDRWTAAGRFPREPPGNGEVGESSQAGVSPPVTTPVVRWGESYVIASGEIRPATRTPRVWALSVDRAASAFGTVNWLTLGGYLLVLVAIGGVCSRREATTESFFLGGRRIPWWAAGLSIFSTVLSAITFLAMPARAYATDWTLLLVNVCVLAVAPLIVLCYLPVLRQYRITTVYEFLGRRFDRSIQRFGSASFLLFQFGRMGIVLLLPALALSAVTGINLYVCIALMGLLATLYTALGGIEAVVWTDVLQTVVLLGGAIAGFVVIARGLEGGVADVWRVGVETSKFHWVNLDVSLVTDSLLVVVLGGLFSNALVPYSSDQCVVQRYLTTSDETAARRSLWLGAMLVLPATFLFLLLGTGLFVFYRQHPDLLAPLQQVDQILPWFVANQMPVGLAGLVIAGVFAAAMSSLDSSMHSIATSVITDWLRPVSRGRSELCWLRMARWITLAAGLFGTLAALILAGLEITYLWDFFLGLLGLIGGTLAGVMAVGVFVPRAAARHVWPGIGLSVGLVVGLKFLTPVHSLLYGFFGVTTVLVVAWGLSLGRRKMPRGSSPA